VVSVFIFTLAGMLHLHAAEVERPAIARPDGRAVRVTGYLALLPGHAATQGVMFALRFVATAPRRESGSLREISGGRAAAPA
jgi:hypothetical protein